MTHPQHVLVPAALASVLDTIDDPFFTLDLDGQFTYANAAAARMVRLTPPELIGRSLERDFAHAFSAKWLEESRRAREENRPIRYDAFNPSYGGWVQVQVVPNASGIGVYLQNITQQHHTAALQRFTVALSQIVRSEDVVKLLIREAVTAAGAYMGALVAPSQDGQHLHLLDEVGYTPELRARFERFPLSLGIPPCDAAIRRTPVFVSGSTFDEVYPGSVGVRAEATRSLAALPLMLEDELWGVLCLSFQEVRQFGEAERQFLDTLVEQATQALTRVRLSAHLQEQAELLSTLNRVNQLVSAELRLDRLVQAVTDAGVELTGAQFGAFFYNVVNERQESYTLYTLSGVPREAFARFPMPRNTQVFGPTFAGEGVVRVADITQDPRYGKNAPYHGMPQGHLPVRSYLAVPVTSRSGEVLGGLFFGHPEPEVFTERAEHLVVGLAAQTAVAVDNARLYQQLHDSHNLLERRVEERTRELQERTQELERSNAELEKFAYVASHDLQEPLRTITSFSELIDRRYSEVLDDRGRQYLRLVSGGAQRMKVLIDDLLVFSRLNAVREPHAAVALDGPLNEALQRLHAALEQGRATVTHGLLPTIVGNPSELTQLFQNLIGNAVKFRREGVAPEIHVSAVNEGKVWHITVQDNGIGFEPEYAERVFQIFQRLHVRDEYEGNGMGLAIVKKIVEHHRGRIWVESTPGSGSTFHLMFPSAETA
ncbi:GAF domain-containing protein [Deinococcus hopiensis]|uniref:histidine kinase n=1 Tax=Deinococcus hopiensis KR-140 TaxID=695939 RepID=A0A1W1UPA2_9DEIO|nr:GAF domain-containing protein [Deinococcus hopiensis]SMB82922.1 PAS domain S-box-containing protein [Deinococcus hopiensis KR-140]